MTSFLVSSDHTMIEKRHYWNYKQNRVLWSDDLTLTLKMGLVHKMYLMCTMKYTAVIYIYIRAVTISDFSLHDYWPLKFTITMYRDIYRNPKKINKKKK